ATRTHAEVFETRRRAHLATVARCAVDYFVHLIYLQRWPSHRCASLLAILGSALPMGKEVRIRCQGEGHPAAHMRGSYALVMRVSMRVCMRVSMRVCMRARGD